jgi:type I restriction enzyme S subunit
MNWKLVKVGDVAKQVRGVSYKPADVSETLDEECLPILRANNITDTGLIFSDFVYVNKRAISKQQMLKTGDIVIAASSGSKSIVGKAGYFNGGYEVSFGAFCKVIRPNENILPKYLSYYFTSDSYRKIISNLSEGANINNLRTEHLDNLVLPLPPLPIQQKIAAILDEADALRRKDKALLAKYDELLQAVFHDMFGDPDDNSGGERLGDIISINPKKSELTISDGTLVSFVPMAYVGEKGEFQPQEDRQYSEVKSGFTYFRDNDVLFAKITPCMENGKGAIAKSLKNGVGFGSTEFHVLRPNENLNAEFLYTYLSRSNFRKLAEKNMTGSAGQKRVSTDFLAGLKLKIPGKDLQEKFAQAYQNIQHQKTQTIQQQTYSESLFQSLMQRAFKGELVG